MNVNVTTLNDLLNIAIQEEVNAQKFYLMAREKSTSIKVKNFLFSIANEEKIHERTLKSIKEMELYDGSLPVDAAMLAAAQASHQIEVPDSLHDLSLEDIFEIAMKKEAQAYTMYDHIAQTAAYEEIKVLFISMAEEERTHHRRIQEHYRAKTGQMGYEG